jgi:nucleoside-diphosphate-sugar epimerase
MEIRGPDAKHSGRDNEGKPVRVLVTGGAGYIGSLLTGVLLDKGYEVTVLDDLCFGGESLLGYWHRAGFRFIKANVANPKAINFRGIDAIVHLAAIVGFPACKSVGRAVAWENNVEATRRIFEAGEAAGVKRFVFASTYSNYGLAQDGRPVTEDSPLHPQSLYAETKIAAEEYLLSRAKDSRCAPLVFRFATLFGISPRTRFDLIINQFVLEALTKGELVVYERGYARSFVHVRDVAAAICLGLTMELNKVRGHVYNVGGDSGNYTKDEIIVLMQKHVAGLKVTYKDISYEGDMRNVAVSYSNIRQALGLEPIVTVEEGIVEGRDVIQQGVIKDSGTARYLNANLITH